MSHLEPSQYRTLFHVSFLSIGSSLYAIHRKYYRLALCPTGVFLTSIHYWRKPEPWARTLDMTYVLGSLTYQVYKAYHAQYRFYYYSITLVAVACIHWHSIILAKNGIGILPMLIAAFMF